jgi:hypothetical protein
VKAFAAGLLLSLVATTAMAGTVDLSGGMQQGGLVRGQTAPGTKVTLDGRAVRVAPDGKFIFGFGREAPAHAALDLTFPDGTTLHRDIEVAARQWDIRRLDGLPPQQVTPDPEIAARIKRDKEEVDKARAVDSDALFFEMPLRWPALGRISGIYGSQSILNGEPRAPHYGVDVAAPIGTPVAAVASGTVSLAERDLYLTGGTIIIDHGYGLSTTYMHLSSVDVTVGQAVKIGDVIGKVGATGRVTGPHLDWRVNWYEVRLDAMLAAGPMPPFQADRQTVNPASADAASRTIDPAPPAPSAPPSH